MTKVWIYTVAASKDPDFVQCSVPWRVDDELIYFGPCKKRMRKRLRKYYLEPSITFKKITDSIFIVGVNGSNPKPERKGVNGSNTKPERKIVWWGKVSEVMTFAEASTRLQGERFRSLRSHTSSPLHVCPIVDDKQRIVGYEHISNEHIKGNAWVYDLVSKNSKSLVCLEGRKLLLNNEMSLSALDLDCCMLLKNCFFAKGKGIRFNEKGVKLLREAQPHKPNGIDDYAVFGRTKKGSANGLKGTFLEVTGELADRFLSWLREQSSI